MTLTIIQHVEAAISALHKLDTLSLEVVDGLALQDEALQDIREEIEGRETYLEAVLNGLKENLEWTADPQDPSSSLQNIKQPEEVGKLVKRRYRELQDQIEHFSNLNSRLQQDHEHVSQQAASLREDLHTQSQIRQKAQGEKKKLEIVVTDLKAELETHNQKLERQKQDGQSIKKQKDKFEAKIKSLETDLAAVRAAYANQQKQLQEVRKEKLKLGNAHKDSKTANAAQQAELRSQAEDLEKAKATQEELRQAITSVGSELDAEKAVSELLGNSLKATYQERDELAKTNNDLSAQLVSSEAKVLAQIKRTDEAQVEKTKVAKDLKDVLDAVKAKLRTETERAQLVTKEKDKQITGLQASLKDVQTQLEQQRQLLKNRPAELEKRLEQESAKHKETLAELKHALLEKDKLIGNNNELDTEVKALQADLEEEKISRQRSVSEYKTMLEAESVKHQGLVIGLQQHLHDQRIGSESAKKDYEERLRNQETECTRLLKEAQAARDQISSKQGELEEMRRSHEAHLQRKTKEHDDLRDLYNTSITENDRFTWDLQNLLTSRLRSTPDVRHQCPVSSHND